MQSTIKRYIPWMTHPTKEGEVYNLGEYDTIRLAQDAANFEEKQRGNMLAEIETVRRAK